MQLILYQARKRSDALLTLIAERLVAEAQWMEPRDIVRSIYGLAKFSFNEDKGVVLGMLSAQARRRIYNYSMDDLSQILASLNRVGIKNQPLVAAVVGRVSEDSVRSMSSEALVNLMSGFSRSGVRSTKKQDPWRILGDELAARVHSSPGSIRRHDMLSALVSYAYPHINVAHEDLFSRISFSLLLQGESLSAEEVCRYVLACARTQYRNLEALAFCAQSLRSREGWVVEISNEKLLKLCTGLDKLGVEMKEIDQELVNRGVSVPARNSVTWFKEKFR